MNRVNVISTRGTRMNIQLDKQTEAFIERKVKDGTFKDASEAIREAVILWAERDDRMRALRDALQIGIDQAHRGECLPLAPDLVEKAIAEAHRRIDAGIPPKRDVLP